VSLAFKPCQRRVDRTVRHLDQAEVVDTRHQLCRAGRGDPQTFVVSPQLELEMLRSWPYVRHNLIHDLAALNKAEMLLWDSWGLMERDEPAPEGDVQRLDRVAEATASADLDLSELRHLYEREPDLRVPAEIVGYDPLGGPPRTVALQTH
jgi:hypothetical protein